MTKNTDFLITLNNELERRKGSDSDSSYTASLFEKGDNAILKKIAEESGEVIMATKDGKKDEIIYEVADLIYHTMVLLTAKDIRIEQVVDELARRSGTSGLDEKASRKNKAT